jgi:hypothetical protein
MKPWRETCPPLLEPAAIVPTGGYEPTHHYPPTACEGPSRLSTETAARHSDPWIDHRQLASRAAILLRTEMDVFLAVSTFRMPHGGKRSSQNSIELC